MAMIVREDIDRILADDLGWQQFSGATVVVSGANGFLPAYMVETLLELGARNKAHSPKIVGLVRNIARAKMRFACYADNPNLHLVEQDIAHPLVYDGGADFIVHAASQASPIYYRTDPVGTFNANVFGTSNLLELARKKHCRGFLFFSSGEVYGQATVVPTPEDAYGVVDPVAVRSCYAEGKRASETMCVIWSHQYGVPTRIVRPFHSYGPGMRLDDGRVFADFVAAIIARRDLVIKSDGTARRPFCYISDATRAFFRVLLHGRDGTPYNVGNDQTEVSIRELADILVGEFGERSLHVVMDSSRENQDYMQSPIQRNCPDIGRIAGLGWRPEIGVAAGFRRTVSAHEEMSFT
jgi:nucleoside-diphosphate-sugar epimerase